jgi:hypothetical protein
VYWGGISENKMSDSCSVQCIHEEWLNIDLKDKGRGHVVEVDVGGRVILKCILKT